MRETHKCVENCLFSHSTQCSSHPCWSSTLNSSIYLIMFLKFSLHCHVINTLIKVRRKVFCLFVLFCFTDSLFCIICFYMWHFYIYSQVEINICFVCPLLFLILTLQRNINLKKHFIKILGYIISAVVQAFVHFVAVLVYAPAISHTTMALCCAVCSIVFTLRVVVTNQS